MVFERRQTAAPFHIWDSTGPRVGPRDGMRFTPMELGDFFGGLRAICVAVQGKELAEWGWMADGRP